MSHYPQEAARWRLLQPARPVADVTVTPACHPGTMQEQLVLVEPVERQWELDDHTREIGRRGVEQARQALRNAKAARPAAA